MIDVWDTKDRIMWQEDEKGTEQMLREQIRTQQLEIQRLKRKIKELEDND